MLFSILIFTACNKNLSSSKFQLKKGDLLFQDIDCGDFCESIESVTFGYRGCRFSHVAIVDIVAMDTLVIEAVGIGVHTLTIDAFLKKSKNPKNEPKVIVGRLKSKYWNLIPKAIVSCRNLIGKPYDDVFDIENDKYYCSELIYTGFKEANNNVPVFDLNPMTFKAPKSNKVFPIWQKYFDDLKIEVPEGKPGLNPGGISLSPKLNIVYVYGKPDGWK
jgi:uncharacterized protein YycO